MDRATEEQHGEDRTKIRRNRPMTETLANGIYTIPMAEYLAHPGVSNSDMQTYRRGSPAVVAWRRANREPETDATRIGTAAHCMILEGQEAWLERYVVKPEGMEFRSNENKAKRDEWIAKGLTILSAAEAEQVRAIYAAFVSKMEAFRSLAEADGFERSVFWTPEGIGVQCKARPDWFCATATYDLKVSVIAEDRPSLVRRAFRNGWFHQLAHARAGLNACGVMASVGRLVVISPEPPQELRVWLLEASERDLDMLQMENEATLQNIAALGPDRSRWPNTPETWQQVGIYQQEEGSDGPEDGEL